MYNLRVRRSRALLTLTALIAASTLVGWYARELLDSFATRKSVPLLTMPLPPAEPHSKTAQDMAGLADLQPASGGAYPKEVIETIKTTCHQRRDLPASSMDAYCGCYVTRLQSHISLQDWLLLNEAIRTTGPQGLGTNEKKILGVVFQDTFDCYQKYGGG